MITFKRGDRVRLDLTDRSWHAVRRYQKIYRDDASFEVLKLVTRTRDKASHTRTYWYYHLNGIFDAVPIRYVKPLISYDGELTEDILIANRVFGKLKIK